MLSTAHFESALFEAVEQRDGKAVSHLIAAGANPNAKLGGTTTALRHAASEPTLGVIQALLEGGADGEEGINSVVFYLDHGGTVHKKAVEIFTLFLDHGIDPAAPRGWPKQTALSVATDRLRPALEKAIADHRTTKKGPKFAK